MKKALAILATIAIALTISGCSKRRIDIEETGSVGVPGTSWQIFCDGPNAVMWVPGRSGDADEIEAYVYDHYKCAPQFYDQNPDAEPQIVRPDEDGIVEDEE